MAVTEPLVPGWVECRTSEEAAGVQRVPFAFPGSVLDQSSDSWATLVVIACYRPLLPSFVHQQIDSCDPILQIEKLAELSSKLWTFDSVPSSDTIESEVYVSFLYWWLLRWCCESAALNMPTNLENSAVATGLEKVSFHSNTKERQCQRMLNLLCNCAHLTC